MTQLFGGRGGWSSDSDLYDIDPSTAAPTSIGATGYALTGLACDPTSDADDNLYGATSNNSTAAPRSLIKVDRLTGAAALIGPFGLETIDNPNETASDITFAIDGSLYGIGTATGRVFTVDTTTGGATYLSDPDGAESGAIAWLGAILYVIGANTFDVFTINPSTGAATFVNTIGSVTGKCQAADSDSGLIYFSRQGGANSSLITLDPALLPAGHEFIGNMFTSGAPMDALAFLRVPPPPPPPVHPIRTFVGSPWRILVTDTAMQTVSVLDRKATQRQFLFTLNGPAYHTGQVASDDPDINIPFPTLDSPAVITHNRRLLYALRREPGADPPYVCRFSGIITGLEDQGTDTPTSRYTATDPWQYMMSRPFRNPETGALPGPDGYKFPAGTRASEIAVLALINTEAVDGETYIYTDGTAFPLVEDTDPLADPFTVDAGLSVGELWQQLCATGTIDIHLPPMYEPFDAPGKLCGFQTVRQANGVAAGPVRFDAVMNWDGPGHSLAAVNRLVDGTRMANALQYFDGENPVPFQSDAASIAAYGQWWAQQFFPGGSKAGLVELMALAELQIRRNGARSISLDPAPERTELPLRDYGLGDYLPVWASRNLREPLGVDYDAFDPANPGASGFLRIFAIPIELDDNGTEMTRAIATVSELAGGS